ncbi:MAG: hypothetical protein AB7C95_00660 [Synergistaceae bacterium]
MFDRKLAVLLGNETVDALQTLAEKHGLSVRFKGGKYGISGCKITVEFSQVNKDGSVETEEMVALRRVHPELVNKLFDNGGAVFKIIGFKPRSPKYPFIAANESGTRYKFSELR